MSIFQSQIDDASHKASPSIPPATCCTVVSSYRRLQKMHRLPSLHAIRRIRISAVLLLTICLLVPASLVVLMWAFIQADNRLLSAGLIMVMLGAVLVPVQWMYAARANCPLCITPVLVSKGCARNRNAKTLFGSYRLRVAVSVFFTGTFRCPYCGESSVLVVRERRRD